MGILRSGTCKALEEEATRLIMQSLEGVTSRVAKSDILTPRKQDHRDRMEFLSRTGAQVDPSTMRGQFSKAWNPDKPHLNSRDCPTRAPKISNSWDPDAATATGMLSVEMAAVFEAERLD